jgi:hypothetical protein
MADHNDAGAIGVGGGNGAVDVGGLMDDEHHGGGRVAAAASFPNSILNKLFSECSPDPRGSVHRAWGISLLFVVMYFALSIFESKFMSSKRSIGSGRNGTDRNGRECHYKKNEWAAACRYYSRPSLSLSLFLSPNA